MRNKSIIASYKKTTKSYHRFSFDCNQGVIGNIYIPKGDTIPERITIDLEVDKAKMRKQSAKQVPVKITLEEVNILSLSTDSFGSEK